MKNYMIVAIDFKSVLTVLFLEFCTTSWATSWSAKTSRIDFELQPDSEET